MSHDDVMKWTQFAHHRFFVWIFPAEGPEMQNCDGPVFVSMDMFFNIQSSDRWNETP